MMTTKWIPTKQIDLTSIGLLFLMHTIPIFITLLVVEIVFGVSITFIFSAKLKSCRTILAQRIKVFDAFFLNAFVATLFVTWYFDDTNDDVFRNAEFSSSRFIKFALTVDFFITSLHRMYHKNKIMFKAVHDKQLMACGLKRKKSYLIK
jgi:hypothetical protein